MAKAKSGNSRKHKNNSHRHGSSTGGSVRIHGAGPVISKPVPKGKTV